MSVRFQIAISRLHDGSGGAFWYPDYHRARNAVAHMTKRIPWRDLPRWLHDWPVLDQGAPIRPATRCERRNAVEAELVRCGGRQKGPQAVIG